MSLNLNPWVALLLGILIGWILQWLLELWFFRRRREECQRRLTEVEAQLTKREEELRQTGGRVASLEAELASKVAVAPPSVAVAVEAPSVEAAMPEIETTLPSVEVNVPEIGIALPAVEAPKAEVALPGIALAAGLAGAELPKVAFEAERPEAKLPAVELAAPYVRAELPAVELAAPEIEARLPALELGAPQLEAKLPEGAVEGPEVVLPEVELPKVEARLPEVAVEAPQLELPQIEAALPKVEAKLPEVAVVVPEVVLPEIEAELPQVEARLPEVAVEAPQLELPQIEAALPEVELPKVEAEVPAVELPQVEARAIGAAAAAADDLTVIKGIGPKLAAQLAAAGITSFAALEDASPEQLAGIVKVPAWQKPDFAAWIAEAKIWKQQPRRAGDDLLRIEGIGPVYVAKLRTAGITTFAQLAATDEAQLSKIIQAPAWRWVNYGEWRDQAHLAAAGDEAGLKALQEKLFARGKDNLDLIEGVSEKTAAALEASGISSFAAMGAATPEQLGGIVKKAGVRGGDFAAWIAEGKTRAVGKRVARVKKTESCPQDLSRLEGIGAVYEQKLYAAGIGTYWQVSNLDAAELASLLGIKDFQGVDLAAIKADALRLAQETGTLERTWDGTPPDDFEMLEGIGEVFEGRLYDAGICTYKALAKATVEQLTRICNAQAGRTPDYAAWIAQAKVLLAQRGR